MGRRATAGSFFAFGPVRGVEGLYEVQNNM
jgi:hypothetical protein